MTQINQQTIKNKPIEHLSPIRKLDGSWTKSEEDKAQTFLEQLSIPFQPFPLQGSVNEEVKITTFLEALFQINPFITNKIKNMIYRNLDLKKAAHHSK